MKSMLALLATALLSAGAGACGSAHNNAGSTAGTASKTVADAPAVPWTTRTVPPPTPPGRYLNDGDYDHIGDPDRDNGADNDNDARLDYKRDDNNSYHDSDDGYTLSSSGKPASSPERRAVTAVVKRYYAAIARGDSASACSQVVPILATATPLDAGRLGPPYLHGAKTCSDVMSLLSRHFRTQLASPVEVTGVLVAGDRALALLGSKTMPAGWITVQRERGAWKIDQLFGGTLL
jgi:ketosteroid isomerase-like protein